MRKQFTKEEEDKIIKYGRLQCGVSEIAYLLGYAPKFLRDNKIFNDIYYKALAEGKIDLRETQLNIANNGNATMAIWLGKQYLGQKEVIEQVIDTKTSSNITNLIAQLKGEKIDGVDNVQDNEQT